MVCGDEARRMLEAAGARTRPSRRHDARPARPASTAASRSRAGSCIHARIAGPRRAGLLPRLQGRGRVHHRRRARRLLPLPRRVAAARADEPPRPDRWAAYDRPELVERLTARGAERRPLDHRAARGPALRGLQLARRQGAVAAERRARRQRQPGHRPRAAGLGPGTRCGSATCCACSSTSACGPHPLAGEPSEQLALLERRTALEAPRRRRLRQHAGDDVRRAAVLRRGRAAWTPTMREYMRLVSMLVVDPGGAVRGLAVLPGRLARAARAQHQHGRAGEPRHRARVRRERLERAHRPRRGVLRLGDDVRVLPRARPLHRDDRAPPGRQRGRRARAPRAR